MTGRPRLLKIIWNDVDIRARRVPIPLTGDISDAPCLNCHPTVTHKIFVCDIEQLGFDHSHYATVYECTVCHDQFYCEYTINDEEQMIDEIMFGKDN